MFDDCVIMAGGAGTRLWPASNSRLPKQFLPASDKHSFFSMALERASSVTAKNGRIVVICGKQHIPNVIDQTDKLSAAEKKRMVVIGEPAAKNTAAAIACAVSFSLHSGENRNILVLTSDHIIKPLKIFRENAALAASAQGKLAVFGITPNRPETGYGYIETNNAPEAGLYRVKAFHEKPDIQTAKKYAANKRFFWNSGMFAFNAGFMARQFSLLAPEIFSHFEKIIKPKHLEFSTSKKVKILKTWTGLETAYKKAPGISFDYAIAEKCRETVMVRAAFDWIDIGNWEEYIKLTLNNNTQVYSACSDACYVDSDIPVALAGVEDLIIVIRSGNDGKDPVALITKKGRTQNVRDIVEQLKKNAKTGLL